MRRRTAILSIAALGLGLGGLALSASRAEAADGKKAKVLYITTTKGFHHSACEYSVPVIKKIAQESGAFEVVCSDATDLITPEGLKEFDAICFSNTTGDKNQFPLSEANREALIGAIKDGKGFIGIHAATDTYKDWAPFTEMIGGAFNGHPWHEPVTINVESPANPAASPVPSPWTISDEIYTFKGYDRKDRDVIMSLDIPSLKKPGNRDDKDYAIAWCKMHGKGRVFYTGLGHDHEVWDNPFFQRHLLNGIKWVLGQVQAELNIGHPRVESTKWVKLLEGDALKYGTDWETTENKEETRKHWSIQDGMLVGKHVAGTPGSSHLYYTGKKFKNFEYRAKVCVNVNGNSGMYFRCLDSNKNSKGEWKNWPDGYEAQVNVDSGDPRRSGTFYPEPSVRENDLKRLIGYDKEKEKTNQNFWYEEHITAIGNHVVIKLNGNVAVDVPDISKARDKPYAKEGYFSFQFHDPGTVVKFKDIEVRELP